MTEIRALHSDEYGLLESIHDGFKPDPKSSVAIIAEDGEETVGRIFLLAPVHVEGPWIKESHRGRLLAGQLIKRAECEAKKQGVSKVFAYAATDEIADYMKRLGYKKWNVTVWTKEL